LIVSVGRLERYKGHQRLITALPSIRQQRPDARLLILGTGPYEGDLRLLARLEGVAEAVEIRSLPAHDRQEMARTLAGAALVALLSEYEAHPIAVLEALSIQRPVLVANTSGLRELGQQGLVRTVELNSTPQEIARAALHQIDESLVPAITALPTWDECASQLIQLYEEAVAVRRSACVF
jgi:glycosyltransferase involved in cell wall biosynthesis